MFEPYLIEASDPVTVDAWLDENLATVHAAVDDVGAVLFRGFAPCEPSAFGAVAQRIGGDLQEYRDRSSPRSVVDGRVYTSTEYPADQPIPFHNENSYSASWPATVAFQAAVPPTSGGETPLSDVRAIRTAIDPDVLDRFAREGVRYVRNLGGGLGLDWRTVFQTESRDEVERACRDGGMTAEWRANGARLRITTTRPAVRRHPRTGGAVWFNHALLFHVTSLGEELAGTLRAVLPPEDLPSNTYFGNGDAIPDDVVAHLAAAYASVSYQFRWQQDDVLVFDNMRLAHGRNAFSGPRRILAAMAGVWSDRDAPPSPDPVASHR